MQINCPCCGNAFEIESEPIVGQHVVCPFCSGKFSYADAGNQNEDRHRGDVLEYLHKKIVIRCPECGTEYEIDNDAIGSKWQCGICNRDFIARDDSSVEIGEAQERDGIAGTGVLDVEDKDDSSEQSGKDLPTKERSAFFTQTFLLVVKAKNRISALWKLGVGRISVILTKERMNAVCLKAKEISSGTKNQIVRLWKSGMKGKALLCALAALVVWLGFFLMCGGGPKAGEVSAKFRAYDFAVGDTSDLGNSSFRKKKGIKASDVSECFDKGGKGLVNVEIPDSVESIGDEAFCGCENLTSVKIGSRVAEIECRSFEKCVSLKSVTIPNSVKYVRMDAFADCGGLTSVVIPNDVALFCGAFKNCKNLRSVTGGGSGMKILSGAFDGCDQLVDKNGFKIVLGWLLDR